MREDMRDTELGWRFVSPPFYKKGGRSENSFALRIWGYGIPFLAHQDS